jgi:serine/threonine protein kinase
VFYWFVRTNLDGEPQEKASRSIIRGLDYGPVGLNAPSKGRAISREHSRQKGELVGVVLEGAYRITRLIGEGGMGAVYEAVQLRLNKRVAVKLMSRELASPTPRR